MLPERFFAFTALASVSALIVLSGSSYVFAGALQFPTDGSALRLTTDIRAIPSPRIRLRWDAYPGTDHYVIWRKLVTDPRFDFANPIAANVPGSATEWTDPTSAVVVGAHFDYKVLRVIPVPPDPGELPSFREAYGQIAAGIERPLVESRGKLILVIESSKATGLAAELARLEEDLAGDGWTVLRHDFSAQQTVPQLKALIVSDYVSDPIGVRALLLFGHLPVPYSGDTTYDGHFSGLDSHVGAWPADVYYADMIGTWTDTTANITTAPRMQNWNVPGDGKFDNNMVGDIKVSYGRVDLANMSGFLPLGESELLRQYLKKHHFYRNGITSYARRAKYQAWGWPSANWYPLSFAALVSSLSGLFGEVNVSEEVYFEKPAPKDYLFAGAFDTAHWLGMYHIGWTAPIQTYYTPNFAEDPVRAVFTTLYGSYFGDWDNDNNFLRAPLCNGDILSSIYLGPNVNNLPLCYFYDMALGGTMGESLIGMLQQSAFTGGKMPTPFDIMGDPTLRMHVVKPARRLVALGVNNNSQVQLIWTPSSETAAGGIHDPGLQGYHVYRGASRRGPFQRLNSSLLTSTTYVDPAPSSTERNYMVRAVKLETTPCGTYFNGSQGAFNSLLLTSVVFNATTFSFSVHGPIGLVCTIESAPTIDAAIWQSAGTVSLNDGTATFSIPATGPNQFFRVRSGDYRSANAVGYTKVTVPTGLSLFANTLLMGNNTVPELFASTPMAGFVTVYQPPTPGRIYVYDPDIGWSGGPFSLIPGEAAWIDNLTGGALTMQFAGEVPQDRQQVDIPSGVSLRSSPLPKSGAIASALGFPTRPPEFTTPPGFTISRWVSGAWVPYSYSNGAWLPSEPVIGLGEAFRIDYSTTGSTTWTKDYWAWSPF